MKWCLQTDTLTLRQRPRSFHAVSLLLHALEAFYQEHRRCGERDGGVRGRPRLDVLPESGRSTVVSVGKAPRCRLRAYGCGGKQKLTRTRQFLRQLDAQPL